MTATLTKAKLASLVTCFISEEATVTDQRVEIYRTHNVPEMHGFRVLLEEAGYPPIIIGERLQGVIGDVPMLESTAMQLLVEKSHAEPARRLIDEMLERKKQSKRDEDRCLACGQLMTSSSRCAECGWSYDDGTTTADVPTVDEDKRAEPEQAMQMTVVVPEETPPSVQRDIALLKWDIAVVIALCVAPGLLNSFLIVLDPYTFAERQAHHFVSLAMNAACTSFVLIGYLLRSGWRCQEFGLTRPTLLDVIWGVGLAVICYYGFAYISWMLPFNEYSSGFRFPPARSTTDYVWMVIGHAANAFQEEVAVRGVLITLFLQVRLSRTWSVIAAAGCFASYHLYWGLVGVQDTFLIGLFFGVLFLKTRRVWPFVFGHWFYNVMLELQVGT